MRVAYYSPLPPERSGIADYSDLLLPQLEQRLNIHAVSYTHLTLPTKRIV